MTYLVAALGCAILFALFAFVRPKRECTTACGSCSLVCGVRDVEKAHD